MDPATITLLLGLVGIVRTLADTGTITDDQRAKLREAESLLEAKLTDDITKDLGDGATPSD